jgi:hypothetical protein
MKWERYAFDSYKDGPSQQYLSKVMQGADEEQIDD